MVHDRCLPVALLIECTFENSRYLYARFSDSIVSGLNPFEQKNREGDKK